MAVNALSLAECLRPWRTAGITAFLADPPTDASALSELEGQEVLSRNLVPHADLSMTRETPTGDLPTNIRQKEYEAPKAAVALSAGGVPQARAGQAPMAATGTHRRTLPDTPQSSSQNAPANAEAFDTSNWPEEWRTLMARTAPAPIVWTYAELGEDLSGQKNAERGDCLRQIIGALRLPKGSSSFWPVCLASAEDGRETARAEMSPHTPALAACRYFQAGLRLLAPKVVILLGTQTLSLSGLKLHVSIPFTQQIHRGVLHMLLPGFDELLAKPSLKEQSCVFLRTALTGLLISQK